jgi:hypothetical protein
MSRPVELPRAISSGRAARQTIPLLLDAQAEPKDGAIVRRHELRELIAAAGFPPCGWFGFRIRGRRQWFDAIATLPASDLNKLARLLELQGRIVVPDHARAAEDAARNQRLERAIAFQRDLETAGNINDHDSGRDR